MAWPAFCPYYLAMHAIYLSLCEWEPRLFDPLFHMRLAENGWIAWLA